MKANKRTNKIGSIVGTALLLLTMSCSELVHTQVTPPELYFEKPELQANGSDQLVLTAKVKNQLSTRQRLKFSTTNGTLILMPQSSASVESDSSILVNPGTTEIRAVLRSSLTADENVVISASVGSLTTFQTMKFNRSCPDEILADLPKTTVAPNETIDFDLVFLRDDGKKISLDARVDCFVDNADSVQITPRIFSDELGRASLTLKNIKRTGSISLTFTDRSGCDKEIQSKTLTVKE